MARSTKPHANTIALNLGNIAELAEGQAEAVCNAALQAAIRDTEDRGDDGKPRKTTIEVEFYKLGDDSISAEVKAKTTMPPYRTKPTIGRLTSDGRRAEMTFSSASAENPEQPALPGVEGEIE